MWFKVLDLRLRGDDDLMGISCGQRKKACEFRRLFYVDRKRLITLAIPS